MISEVAASVEVSQQANPFLSCYNMSLIIQRSSSTYSIECEGKIWRPDVIQRRQDKATTMTFWFVEI